MISCLSQNYENTQAMMFGDTPELKDILDSIGLFEDALNSEPLRVGLMETKMSDNTSLRHDADR